MLGRTILDSGILNLGGIHEWVMLTILLAILWVYANPIIPRNESARSASSIGLGFAGIADRADMIWSCDVGNTRKSLFACGRCAAD
jgi:hypothetical protein